MASKGLSIHIGLNHVDPSCYNGWDGALSGCLNDANDMFNVASSMGYQPKLLTDSAATAERVVSEIGIAAQQLTSGDILFLTYSGHGGQVPDVNGDEDDGQDETWVLWDRQLVDDELGALWSHFTAGVRIVILSDSCHSGTVMRMLATSRDLMRPSRKRGLPDPAAKAVLAALAQVLAGPPREGPAAGPAASYAVPEPSTGPAASYAAPEPAAVVDLNARFKVIPRDVQDLVNSTHARELAASQFVAGPEERAPIGASVLLISGCQDWQLSMDGTNNGLFTEKVKQVWNGGAFQGDYRSFWTQVRGLMPASQQPNLATTGAPNPAFEGQRPFTIEAPVVGGATPTTSGHPTLRRGDRGPEVVTLQQKLNAAGAHLTVDGDFGFGTEAAVRSFQSSHGLSPDGVVGASTWAALEGGSSAPSPAASSTTGVGNTGSPSTSPVTRPTLRRGSTGPDVVYLQQRLVAFGHNLTPDGQFGAMTESAVRSFQASNGLVADGVVGAATWAKLG